MRWHWVVAAVLLLVAGGWFVAGPRTEVTDEAYTRDKIVSSDAVVTTYSNTWTEGYRYTRLEGEGWTWERLDPEGEPYDDIIVNNGEYTAVRLAPGCWAPIRNVRPPFIPGVTVAERLKEMDGVDQEETTFTYSVPPGGSSISSFDERSDVHVVEDLSGVSERRFTATTTGSDPIFFYGDYVIGEATETETQRARDVIASLRPSSTAHMEIRERILTTLISNAITGPFDLLVAADCPDTPVVLRPASRGGQRGGPRIAKPNFDLAIVNGAGTVLSARTINAPLITEAQGLLVASNHTDARDTAIRDALVVVVEPQEGVRIAVEFATCDGQPYFPC